MNKFQWRRQESCLEKEALKSLWHDELFINSINIQKKFLPSFLILDVELEVFLFLAYFACLVLIKMLMKCFLVKDEKSTSKPST